MSETKRPTNTLAEEILGLYFPVFEGFISLKDYMGGDEQVEEAARVSYGAGTRKTSQTKGLIRYLKRHQHSTPSEMVELKFHICCPIFVARQWVRHRMSSTNEYSGRYSLMPMMFYTPEKENFALQSSLNNQGRGVVADDKFYNETIAKWNSIRAENISLYENLTDNDLARELARIDLPLSTYTQFYWKINLHNLLHFLTLRVDAHAQFEIQEYGKIIAGMIKRIAPISYEAWIDYDVCGVKLSRMELDALKEIVVAGQTEECGKYIANVGQDGFVYEKELPEISSREFNEFWLKFNNTKQDVPNFELDLSKAKDGAYFEEKMIASVPKKKA